MAVSQPRRTPVRTSVAVAAVAATIVSVTPGQALAHEPEQAGAPDTAGAAAQAGEPVPTATVTVEPAAPAPVVHVVQRGESLSSIATAAGLSREEGWRRLFDANPHIVAPDVIFPGQHVRIPAPDEHVAARSVPAPAPAATPAPARGASAATTPPSGASRALTPAPRTSRSNASAGVWDRLAACESGGNWQINTGNGYYGGLQFSLSSWRAVGGAGYPHQASKGEQIERATLLQARQGWGAWPACSRKLGLR